MIAAGISPNVVAIGNDTASVFSFAFPTFESANLEVYVKDSLGVRTDLVLVTDYTINGVGQLSGGSITLVNASQAWLVAGLLTAGYTLYINYKIRPKQLARFRDLGPHAPAAFEVALDRLTMDLIALVGNEGSVDAMAATFLDTAYEPSGPQILGAGGVIVIQALKRQHIRIVSDGGVDALNAHPFGVDSSLFLDGMEIVIEPQSATLYHTLAESDTQYGYTGNGGLILRKKMLTTFVYSAIQERFLLKSGGAW